MEQFFLAVAIALILLMFLSLYRVLAGPTILDRMLGGNVIGPKILGDSTGIPSFWVIFAILFGAGLFGFVGMLVGIPIFAIIYHYIGRFTRHKLRKRNMPTETAFYRDMSNYTSERLLGSKKKKPLK